MLNTTSIPTMLISFEDRLKAELIASLDAENLFKVLHFSENCGEVLNDLITFKPNFLLIDCSTYASTNKEIMRILEIQKLSTRIIVYAKDPNMLKSYLGDSYSPIISIIHDKVSKNEFLMYLQLIFLGKVIVSSIFEKPVNVTSTDKYLSLHTLSEREKDVWDLLIKAKTESEIAGALHISVFTVRKHKSNITDKLGIRNKQRLTAFIFDFLKNQIS